MNGPVKMWLDALKNGKFPQTTGCLNDGVGYCCLGVACELYNNNVKYIKMKTYEPSKDQTVIGYDGFSYFLPKEVQLWLGLRTDCGEHTVIDDEGRITFSSLSRLNDEGSSFGEIAKIIESEPKGLFTQTA